MAAKVFTKVNTRKMKKWIIYQFGTIYNYVNFWLKKKEADRMHKTTGKRYHVVPAGKYSLRVVDNTFVALYNKSVPKAKRIDIKDLLHMSYYSTSLEPLTRKK